jgi:transcriptional regulator with GAF, ATPase, and Fis domain/tetratricopeptide (TPR) repeat protein
LNVSFFYLFDYNRGRQIKGEPAMEKALPDFSEQQWEFLGVLEALNDAVPISLVGNIVPLPPGPLFDFITQTKALGWVVQEGEDCFGITGKLPTAVLRELRSMNSKKRLSYLAHRLKEMERTPKLKPQTIIRLMESAGLEKEAAELEVESAEHALSAGDYEGAWDLLQSAKDRLADHLDCTESQAIYISALLKLSNLSFSLGKGFRDLANQLNRAHQVAQKLGDQRSHALINLHLGFLFYFSARREEALVSLSLGLNEVEELGDEDIIEQSSSFLGLFYFMQGSFKEALEYLEKVDRLQNERKGGEFLNPISPMFLGYCLTYLGEFHRAIGSLDTNWRMAQAKSDQSTSSTLRAILGTVLLLIGKFREAVLHLEAALEEARASHNSLALYVARGGLALRHMMQGQTAKARDLLFKAFSEGEKEGLVRQYASPWILEMLFEFEQLGLEPYPGLKFSTQFERAEREHNIHLQGVALRLQAKEKHTKGSGYSPVLADLNESREYLIRSGDSTQLSKTLIEKARLFLANGKRTEAEEEAKEAWRVLGGYADDLFPDDLRHLLQPTVEAEQLQAYPEQSFHRYLDLFEAFLPVRNQDEIMSRAVIATTRFFGAERGGLFYFPGGEVTGSPELLAGCNLLEMNVRAADFQPSLELILKSFREKQTIIHTKSGNATDGDRLNKSILCLPVKVRGRMQGVLYHDNSYLQDCFGFLDSSMLVKLVNHVSQMAERAGEYFRIKEERDDLVSQRSVEREVTNEEGLIFKSPIMGELIERADKVAPSDSTILILGETGVGKELLARRIHRMSRRHDKAFIIVDATTIPETLMESELFGHEKGSFTGADRQKRGRLELADGGTAFIDEIGEIPKSMQIKMLRVLQEKTFYRVGGMRPLRSDFRLIAATNRDLAKEVEEGRFREDLYYRLNVVPLRLPPLRERKEDVPLLAGFFLDDFARKYHRRKLEVGADTRAVLKAYHWPGNVRELENVIERAALLSSDGQVKIDFPLSSSAERSVTFADMPELEELERRYIKYVLTKTGGRIGGPGGAAQILGMKRTTLNARLKRLGIR